MKNRESQKDKMRIVNWKKVKERFKQRQNEEETSDEVQKKCYRFKEMDKERD